MDKYLSLAISLVTCLITFFTLLKLILNAYFKKANELEMTGNY